MSKIAEQILKLKEQEQRLHRETRKVEFLTHILDSAREYEHSAFSDVKSEVLTLLDNFVKKTIEAIEAGTEVTITVGSTGPAASTINLVPEVPAVPSQQPSVAPVQPKQPKQPELSPNEKLAFALANRHLGGKEVLVMNDKNVTIRGKVVGLDAPFVMVKTETGPVVMVPLPNISLQ